MEIKLEVLVIDNYLDTAQSYADLIETQCQLKSVATSNIDSALKYVSENPIKIVVLDQVMPIKGTDVFPQLMKINPFLKIVMVSGEASYEDAANARKIGYSDILHKKDIADLPNIIFKLRSEYEKGLTKSIKDSKPFHREWKLKPSHLGSIKYYLLDYMVIEENFIKKSDWKTLEKINQGEKQSKEVTIELKIIDKISVSEESKLQLKKTTKTFLPNLDVALDSSILFSKEVEKSKTETIKKTTELSLRDDEMIEGKKVLSKNYETNQVYKQILLHIKKECGFCGEQTIFPLMIYKPVNKKTYRQISYTEDNMDYTIKTGDFTW
jgi:CheY-like chemotaxis protein